MTDIIYDIEEAANTLATKGVIFLPGLATYFVNRRDRVLVVKEPNMSYPVMVKYEVDYEDKDLFSTVFDPQPMFRKQNTVKREIPYENIIYKLANQNWEVLAKPFFTEVEEFHCGAYTIKRNGDITNFGKEAVIGEWWPEFKYEDVMSGIYGYFINGRTSSQTFLETQIRTTSYVADECISYATTAMRASGILNLWYQYGKDEELVDNYMMRVRLLSKMKYSKQSKERYMDEI